MTLCKQCQLPLADNPPGTERQPCPQCGCLARTFELEINEAIKVYEGWRAIHKRPGYRRFMADIFTGWERRHSVGDMVRKDRLLDKENDRYLEHIETENGEVIHHCVEPLSAHFGHGSAKLKPDPSGTET